MFNFDKDLLSTNNLIIGATVAVVGIIAGYCFHAASKGKERESLIKEDKKRVPKEKMEKETNETSGLWISPTGGATGKPLDVMVHLNEIGHLLRVLKGDDPEEAKVAKGTLMYVTMMSFENPELTDPRSSKAPKDVVAEYKEKMEEEYIRNAIPRSSENYRLFLEYMEFLEENYLS